MRSAWARTVARLRTNSNSCTASFTQVAGIEALNGDQASVDSMNAEFRRRRDRFYAGINQVKGFSCLKPQGAFYMFPNLRETGLPSRQLADALVDDVGV